MTNRRLSAAVGVFIAVAVSVAGWSALTTRSTVIVATRAASPTLVVGSGPADAPLAVISNTDNTTLTSFARLDRSSRTGAFTSGLFVVTHSGDTSQWRARPLAAVVENAIRTRAARVGPVPGRAPPAPAIFR